MFTEEKRISSRIVLAVYPPSPVALGWLGLMDDTSMLLDYSNGSQQSLFIVDGLVHQRM